MLECWDRKVKDYVAVKIVRNVDKYRHAAMIEVGLTVGERWWDWSVGRLGKKRWGWLGVVITAGNMDQYSCASEIAWKGYWLGCI